MGCRRESGSFTCFGSPWSAGCGSLAVWPLHYLTRGENKAVIGGWDPSARKFFKTDELSFTVPFQMFRDMLKRHGESFLTTKDWETVQKKITRSKKTWGETLSVKRDGENAMSKVILINPFEVPEGREDECLAFWEKAADFMRCQPGFISTRLHKAVSPEAKFRFINMAEWESTEHFQTAIESETFKELTAP